MRLLLIFMGLLGFLHAQDRTKSPEMRAKLEELEKQKPKPTESEIGLWLDTSSILIPYYVRIESAGKDKVRITRFHSDGSKGKGELKEIKGERIDLGRFGEYYRINGESLSIWDDAGKIHELKLIRRKPKEKKTN